MTSAAHEEEDRRRRALALAVFGGALLLLLGLFGGWLAFGDDSTADTKALGAIASPSPTPAASIVLPSPQAAGRPTGSPSPSAMAGDSFSESVSGSSSGSAVSSPGRRLALSGTVVGSVAPGQAARLVVTITNRGNQRVELSSVSASVTSVSSAGLAGAPTCSASWYHVGSFTGPRTIAKGASTTVELPITFSNSATTNQDNCKGAQYRYSFTAQARQA